MMNSYNFIGSPGNPGKKKGRGTKLTFFQRRHFPDGQPARGEVPDASGQGKANQGHSDVRLTPVSTALTKEMREKC